jgi:hypothetical protein
LKHQALSTASVVPESIAQSGGLRGYVGLAKPARPQTPRFTLLLAVWLSPFLALLHLV